MKATRLTPGASAALLVGLLALCFAVAGLGALSTAESVRTWYPTLEKAPWTPPNWVFGPVWTVLYTAMAVAAWDVVRRNPRAARGPMALFAVQLVLNALWSPVFFAWHQLGAALALVVGLWLGIAACIAAFLPHSRIAAALMVPYLMWVSVAVSLNAWIWWFTL